MALVVDGVFFQLAQSGIARVWRAILPLLKDRLDMPIFLLDRGGIKEQFPGIELVPFPMYKSSKFTPADSQLLEYVCRHFAAKVFVSTYYSTPMETPSLLMVHDMIPELLQLDLTAREWREKELAIAHARRIVCVSQNARNDLLAAYSELPPELVTVAHYGLDPRVYYPRQPEELSRLRECLGLDRPYFILVGSPVQTKNYKNASHFFEAVATLSEVDFDVLCVGSEKSTSFPRVDHVGHRVVYADLDDNQLAVAYTGAAAALAYPSLYEGFGLPVIEAMACGCPVISTLGGALGEVAGEAALSVSGSDLPEMVRALLQVRDPLMRARLIERGKLQAAQFRWEPMADKVACAIRALANEADNGMHSAFYRRWAHLRQLQGEVDAIV